jgi:hypothetical protein
MYEDNESNFKVSSLFFASLSLILVSAALLVYFLLPSDKNSEVEEIVTITNFSEENEEDFSAAFQDYFSEYTVKKLNDNTDTGLILYRQPLSRAAVEWFYCQITGNREVAVAILEQADANDIPLSLAFALAHTESTFNTRAINRNTNNSIDRGLFQLNSNSFPGLNETDFYDANISAKYGLSHLKFCLGYAGNEVSALAMYNAGTNRVRSNKTPLTTLNYIGKILTYQRMLEQLFAEQVTPYFENETAPAITVAYVGRK